MGDLANVKVVVGGRDALATGDLYTKLGGSLWRGLFTLLCCGPDFQICPHGVLFFCGHIVLQVRKSPSGNCDGGGGPSELSEVPLFSEVAPADATADRGMASRRPRLATDSEHR